jgi:aminoglycoside phosphotransferase (APT) family kinase protein
VRNQTSPTEVNTRIAAVIRTRLSQERPSHWLPQPNAVKLLLLAVGEYHANFLVTSGGFTSVARLCRRSQWGLTDSDQLAREFAVLQDIETSGAGPSAIALFNDVPNPFLIEEYVAGAPPNLEMHVTQIGETLAAAHACQPIRSAPKLDHRTSFEFLLSDGLAMLEGCRGLSRTLDAVRLLHELAASLVPAPIDESSAVLTHTDLTQRNMLMREGSCVFLDWEGARLGSRAWDLAYLTSPVTAAWADPPLRPSGWWRRQLIEGYSVAADVDPGSLSGQVRQIQPFVILRALAWCVQRLEAAIASPQLPIGRNAARRLEQIVSQAFIQDMIGIGRSQ